MNIYNSDRFFRSLMARHELRTENSTAWAYKFVKCIALVNSFINCAHSTNTILNRFHILLFFFSLLLEISFSLLLMLLLLLFPSLILLLFSFKKEKIVGNCMSNCIQCVDAVAIKPNAKCVWWYAFPWFSPVRRT